MKNIILASTLLATALMCGCEGNHGPKANLKTDIDTLSYTLGVASSPGEQLNAYLQYIGSDSTAVNEFLKGYNEGYRTGDDKKKSAYLAGLQAGIQSRMNSKRVEQTVFDGDSTKQLSMVNYLAGFHDAIEKKVKLTDVKGEPLTNRTAGEMLSAQLEKKEAEKRAALEKATAEFMAAKAKDAAYAKLENGVLLKTVKPGSGAVPTDSSEIKVNYEGAYIDGEVFDTNWDAEPVTFSLANMIQGWKIACPQMKAGGEYEIIVPGDMAYGPMGQGKMANATLVFKVKLIEVEK